MGQLNEIEYIPVGLASPEKILSWSYGEVTKPETINYKTFKPEKEGLFDERIFGPTKDWHCATWCGTYKSKKPNSKLVGVVCEKCGVEVTNSKVRRERMGHLQLAAPVAHYWYMKTQPYYISTILDVPYKKLESVIYCKTHLVTDPGDTPFQKMQLLSGSEYDHALYEYGNRFKAGIGASVVKQLLEEIDLEELAQKLTDEIKATKTQKRIKLIKRLKIVDAFRRSGNRPEWMVLTYLPIIPPDLRPMVQLDGGRFATSDLNDLYRRIINRNNRLKKLIDVKAPDIIIENEIRMLQEAVDALIANHRRTNPVTGSGKRALKSLSQALEGKQGRFRQNLLGKRVDYSGRSVITVGPNLKIHQVGIPRKMALELFKPFIMHQMVEQGLVQNANQAKRKIDQQHEMVWAILEQVVDQHPVMLNRAPTLHKLSIRSFEPVLVEGEAIMLHPLVCSGFNADFDGDQMAVHVPLSREAQTEARILMLASENLLHPQNGGPAVTHSQDMILGCYYLSIEVDGSKGEGKVFKTEEAAINAFDMGRLGLHAKIILYVKNHPKFSEGKYLVTTVGKIIFNRVVPNGLPYFNDSKIVAPHPEGLFDNIKEAMDYIPNKPNKDMGKKFIQEIIGYAFDKVGRKATADMLDGIKDVGFLYATKGGLTISLFDVETSEEKPVLLKKAEEEITRIENLYGYGRISEEQRYESVVNIWAETTSKVKEVTIDKLSKQSMNPIRMMIDSGARGSEDQFRQLAGMRGLMADPSGRTIERPIKSNFKEGLDVFEFFISSHGARKGMADTSLKTADSGYLTRRMVDVAQDVVVTEEDCGTEEYTLVREIPDWAKLEERIVGRFLARDIVDENNKVVAETGTLIDSELSKEIVKHTDSVPIRSLLVCETKLGICRKCYGIDLATREIVEEGEAVGVIAAQSIGEPGTQLTMRTFHSGGIAGDDITQGLPRIEEIFEARNINVKKGKAILTEVDGKVEIIEKGRLKDVLVHKEDGEYESYPIPYGYTLVVREGQQVQQGARLTTGNINPHELLQLKGMVELQRYLINEVQLVYRQQGVKIDDKHIEVIVRQMSRKVVIKDPGDSKQVPGRIVDRYKLKALNKKLKKEGKKEVVVTDQLLGITGASLATDSFLSSASFQETAKALTDAAIRGKKDYIKGLKESVITGKKIPAGTGFRKYLEEREEMRREDDEEVTD